MKLIALWSLVLGYQRKVKSRKTPETRPGLNTSIFFLKLAPGIIKKLHWWWKDKFDLIRRFAVNIN